MSEPVFDLDAIGGRAAVAALVDEVCAAGEEALRLFRAGIHVEKKPDRSPVTEADKRVEERLRAFIGERFPEHGFIGEETGNVREDAPHRWIVDPIDGTRAFMRGIPSWSVLVGLESHGVPSIGIVFLPAAGTLMIAVRGEGASKDGRSLRVSRVEKLADAMIMHGGLEQFAATRLTSMLGDLAQSAYSCRGFADALGHMHVVDGRAEACVDPGVKAWDLCAVAVVVREAGGRLTDFTGKETIYGGHVIASNGLVHDEVLALVQRHRETGVKHQSP